MSQTGLQTSVEALQDYFPGEQVAAGSGPAWQDLLVNIHARRGLQEGMLVPAVDLSGSPCPKD